MERGAFVTHHRRLEAGPLRHSAVGLEHVDRCLHPLGLLRATREITVRPPADVPVPRHRHPAGLADAVAALRLGVEELDQAAVAAPARARLACGGLAARWQDAALYGGVVDRPLGEGERRLEVGGCAVAKGSVWRRARHPW